MRPAIALLLLAGLVRADEIEFKDGRVVEGKVQDMGDEVRLTRSGAMITFQKSSIKKITYKLTKEEEYEVKKKDLKDDLESHLKLARWCKEAGVKEGANEQYEKVVGFDPEHVEAHTYLGHQQFEGKWLTEAEAMQAKGFVKYKSRWVTPEEREVEIELERAKDIEKRMVDQVRKYLDMLTSRDRKKPAEAREGLAKIEDRFKVKPLIGALTTYSKEIRLYAASELRDPSAIPALVRVRLFDQEKDVRDAALASLKIIDGPDTCLSVMKGLYSEYRSVRRRAMDTLVLFKDMRSIPYLIWLLDQLQQDIRQLSQSDVQSSRVVVKQIKLPDGSEIPMPRRIAVKSSEEEAEEKKRLQEETEDIAVALTAISGKSFGTDVSRWTQWLREQQKKK